MVCLFSGDKPPNDAGALMTNPEKIERTDGRKAMLTYLDPKLIIAVKTQALTEGVHAYELIERILKDQIMPKG